MTISVAAPPRLPAHLCQEAGRRAGDLSARWKWKARCRPPGVTPPRTHAFSRGPLDGWMNGWRRDGVERREGGGSGWKRRVVHSSALKGSRSFRAIWKENKYSVFSVFFNDADISLKFSSAQKKSGLQSENYVSRPVPVCVLECCQNLQVNSRSKMFTFSQKALSCLSHKPLPPHPPTPSPTTAQNGSMSKISFYFLLITL